MTNVEKSYFKLKFYSLDSSLSFQNPPSKQLKAYSRRDRESNAEFLEPDN